MNNIFDELIQKIKSELRLLLSISLGVFLFVLFFQPFPLERFDFNNELIFVGGFAAIVFILMVLFRTIFLSFMKNGNREHKWLPEPSFLSLFLIFALCSVALVFYLRYVGQVNINFYITLKIIAVCFSSVTILGLYDSFKQIKTQNKELITQRKLMQKKLETYEDDLLNKSIEFISENLNENLNLLVKEIALIRSADNYVEIVYEEHDGFKKKLIRNTLKNIELQIKPHSNFLRCHRTSIINTQYIEKLTRNDNGYWLVLKGYNGQIPVSRQYLLKLKEAL